MMGLPAFGAINMPEEKPTLHVDTDWKKQAQEEKRRLAEQEKQRAAESSGATATAPGAPQAPGAESRGAREAASGPAGARGARAPRELPPASFATLVQSMVTQVLFHLGDLSTRGGEPMVNLDMAKHHIDTLGVLEEKTRGNLTDDERRMLDAALYETRMRYVSVASQYIS
jgi:hypothetical protein